MHETRFKIKIKLPAAIFYSSISPTETSIWKFFCFFLNHVSCFVFRSFMGLYKWGFPLFLCPLSDPSITQLCFEPLNHGFRGLFNRLALICCLLLHLKKTNCPFSYFKLSSLCSDSEESCSFQWFFDNFTLCLSLNRPFLNDLMGSSSSDLSQFNQLLCPWTCI